MASIVKTSEITKLKNEVEHLYKTVYQGNGKPSILNQITSIEHRLDSLEEKLDASFKSMETEMSLKFDGITDIVTEKFANITTLISREFEHTKINEVGKLQLKAGVVTATIATITSILALFINHILHLTK